MPKTEKQTETEEIQSTKPLSFRLILFLVLGVLLIGLIWYAYYWYTSTQHRLSQANTLIDQAQQYEVLTEEIQTEYRRCQQFIAQEQGEFGQFEYCKRFINWVNRTTPESNSSQ